MTNPKLETPRIIHLETPHYIVRTLELADATDGWRNWMKDPAALRNLNAKPAERGEAEFRTYIGQFNRMTSHLLGLFEKDTGLLVGIRAIYINPKIQEFLVNVLVGETEARNKGARTESRDVMYRYFFEELDLQAARCSVVSTNEPIMRIMEVNGWVRTRTEHKPAATGEGFVELHDFRLTREVWREREAKEQQAKTT